MRGDDRIGAAVDVDDVGLHAPEVAGEPEHIERVEAPPDCVEHEPHRLRNKPQAGCAIEELLERQPAHVIEGHTQVAQLRRALEEGRGQPRIDGEHGGNAVIAVPFQSLAKVCGHR